MKRRRLISTERLHLVLMLTLTFSTGVIDAVGFLGLDRVFTGNMTGNVVLLGMALAGGDGLSIVRPALALAFFMVGAACAGRVLRSAPTGWSRRTSITLLSVALITAGLAVAVALVDVHAEYLYGSITTSVLGFVMGIQAATAKRLAVAEITTVVVTSTITGLAADSWLAGGKGKLWARRALAISLIGLGALAGAAALLIGLWVGIAASAFLASIVTLLGHLRYRKDRKQMSGAALESAATTA